MGHIISRKYGNKGVEIAKKAYYNIYGEDISNKDVLVYLEDIVSAYAVNKRIMKYGDLFKASSYKEIISEVLAKNLTDSNIFTKEFVKILKEMVM